MCAPSLALAAFVEYGPLWGLVSVPTRTGRMLGSGGFRANCPNDNCLSRSAFESQDATLQAAEARRKSEEAALSSAIREFCSDFVFQRGIAWQRLLMWVVTCEDLLDVRVAYVV
eukprot:3747001-Amphidinium_carterae.1